MSECQQGTHTGTVMEGGDEERYVGTRGQKAR